MVALVWAPLNVATEKITLLLCPRIATLTGCCYMIVYEKKFTIGNLKVEPTILRFDTRVVKVIG